MIDREQAERRYLEIRRRWGSRSYGKCWKPTTPLAIKIEMEQLVAQLTRKAA
jgi:hypothetical protein